MFGEGLVINAMLGTEGFKKGTKEIQQAVKNLAGSTKRFGSQMISSVKRLIPMIIGVGSAYGVISKGVSAFMAENEMLSARMNAIWTAIGNVLGPIITQIIDWVSTAVSYFLGFLKLLGVTGQSASQLSKKANKSAGDLQRTLAGFDELNVLQEPPKENPLPDLEPKEWMAKLAELLKAHAWDEIANMIVDKFNEWINIFKEKAHHFGEVCGEYLQGAIHIIFRVVRDADWKGIGTIISEFFRGLFEQINPEELGAILVAKITIPFKILTGILENGEFLEELGSTISGVIIGAINSLSDTLKTADWQTIGANIIKFFTEDIQWGEIGDAVFGLLETAWNSAIELLKGIITGTGDPEVEEPQIIKSLRNVWEKIDEIKNKINEFCENAWPTLKKILEWGGSEEGLGPVLEALASALSSMMDAILGMVPYIDKFWDGFLKPLLSTITREIVETLGDLGKAFELIAQWLNGEISFREFATGLADIVFGTEELTHTIENTEGDVDKLKQSLSELYQIGSDENKLAAEYGLEGAQYSLREVMKAQDEYREGMQKLSEVTGYSVEQLEAWAAAAHGDFTKIEALNKAFENTGPAMEAATNAMQEGSKEYGEAVDEMASKAEEGAKVTVAANETIEEKTTEKTGQAAESATTNSQKMKDNTTSSAEEMKDETVKEMEDLSTEANRIFSGLSSDAFVWGRDLVSNFITGIDAMLPALVAELQGMANLINSYIGFSKPDKGPLSDFDKSGPDMIDLFASGLEDSKGRLVTALNDIADTVSVRAPGMAGGAVLPYGVAAASGSADAASADATNERLLEAINSLENSLLNNQWVIDFGNFRLVAKELTRVQRQMARAEGV